jgi:hypothetical protein
MRISQLADATGVPATTLRFYESAGLLPAERTAAGYRLYHQDAIERLAFIGAALAAAEQACCPCFDFRLHLAGATVELEVRAPAEGAALLTELFQPAA